MTRIGGKGFCLLFAMTLCATAVTAQAGPVRYWTDASGKFRVLAELVRVDGGSVVLKRQDNGNVVNVPLERLSRADAQLAKYWSDPARRPAIEKFSEIGDVSCDADGAIHLGLSQSGCTDNDLKLVAALPETASIDLFECPISDDGLAALTPLRKLRRLSLEETDVTGAGFKHLAGVTSLEEFTFSPYDSGAEMAPHLVQLAGWKNLKQLILRFCAVGAEGLKPIGGLANLEHLELMDCEIESPALANVAGLKKLRVLTLEGAAIDDADLAHLAGMTELRTLIVDGGRFGSEGMKQIAQFKQLEKLSLPRGLTDADLAPLATMTQLKSLQLRGEEITDAGLANVALLVNLEELFLPESITGAGLKNLRPLKKLKRLEIPGEGVTFSDAMRLLVDGQGRSVMEAMQIALRSDIVEDGKVKWLALDSGPRADRDSMKYVAQLTDLESLSLGAETTDEWLADLAPLVKLKNLHFYGHRFDDKPIKLSAAGLKHLAACKELESLEFNDCVFADAALEAIVGLPKLKSVHFMDCTLGAGNAAAIGKIKPLESLYLYDTSFGDDDVAHLAGLTKLEFLSLPGSVGLKGLAQLKNLKTLTRLQADWRAMSYAQVMQALTDQGARSRDEALAMIMNVRRDDEGRIVALRWADDLPTTTEDLAFLKEWTQLEDLTLPDGVTDEGLANIAGLVHLHSLAADSKKLTDDGLKHLAALQDLETLHVNQAPITDKGLVHLAGLSKLKNVYLYNSEVTDAGVAELQKALPGASIHK